MSKGSKRSSKTTISFAERKRLLRPTATSIFDSLLPPSSYDYSWEELEEYYGESEHRVEPVLSRTSLMLLDYRMFKAARTIQTAFRGWYVRHRLARKQQAAVIIQREWRRFYACRYYYRVLESTLQERIYEYYHQAAQIIQANWRGWWVRENVHDQLSLSRMQVNAAEDLLQCVAFKLHHLLRTRQIPGIYSLLNSHCLSKVEQLLSSISFKQHNNRVRMAHANRDAQLREAKDKFRKSVYQTRIPYAGPNINGYCEPKCCDMYHEIDADKKMHEILSLYDRATRATRSSSKKKEQSKRALTEKINLVAAKSPTFCDDVVHSMQRWKILADNKVSVDPNVFRHPRNVENFLKEVQSIYSLMQERCNCRLNAERLQEMIDFA